ncbi:hypothetical protein SAMN05192575_11648 [Nocardioides alpinus]|uniref:CocE/NonD family hydrolase n=2 Tax=Nocardioides TaxID=1839 RepID=A0A4Q2SMV1_9ACTN|nr:MULTISPECIES: CocE/NonD family hydrolase [Nocardioides]PKH38477.1 hydrolase [Nocardioides alpinus]RYC05378.1 CocE/NonD family hydrolase [Nocardioides zhouii]SFB47932.1 hypothetical protein SAMN05192575_11648 [Nocardioides alpinus]
MRDGTILLADHLAPTGTAKGTILVRSPYGWNFLTTAIFGSFFARNGYHVVLARTRGTFGSGGKFEPVVHEESDGADTAAWLRQQPWFAGNLATLGGSYFGFTQWALLMDPPPELVTSVIWAGPADFRRALYAQGAFNLELALTWSEQLAHQEDFSTLRSMVRGSRVERRVTPALSTLPLKEAADEITGHRWSWFSEWATRRDPDDSFWSSYNVNSALDRVSTPVMLAGGWQDLFITDTLEQYQHLRRRGVDVAMTVGPWTHGEMGTKGVARLLGEALDWLDKHMIGATSSRPSPVSICVAGDNTWRNLEAWPPPTTAHVVHPHADGALALTPAAAGEGATFCYDPSDPTPALGGRMLTPSRSGYQDDSALAMRDDTVSFTGAPLDSALEVIGTPYLEVNHTSDNPHCDLFVRVSDVSPDGKSRNVTDGFVRLDRLPNHPLVLHLDPTAYRFEVGHRLRLHMAGGAFPHYERHLGTAESLGSSTTLVATHHTIDLASARLVLPAVPSKPGGSDDSHVA